MLKTTAVAAALVITGSLFPTQASAAGYTVKVNGAVVSGALAELRNGQLMVAVRPFAEALGGWVDWDAGNMQATIGYHGTQFAFYLGSYTSYQDGQQLRAPVKPYTKDGRTMVPAWFLASRLGAKLSFAGSTLTVSTGTRAVAKVSSPLAQSSYYFPFPSSAEYEAYYDGMGDPRYWQGEQFGHEGTDILAPEGTPIVAVASGTIVRYGWNTLGGYRVNIELDDFPGYRFYYAHMDRYASGIYQGAHVEAGQVLGYVGSTGEGPERTEGKFLDHLHFGIYRPDGSAVNPYPLLKYWENHKVQW